MEMQHANACNRSNEFATSTLNHHSHQDLVTSAFDNIRCGSVAFFLAFSTWCSIYSPPFNLFAVGKKYMQICDDYAKDCQRQNSYPRKLQYEKSCGKVRQQIPLPNYSYHNGKS